MSQLGRVLIVGGVLMVAVGALLVFGERIGLGRLPGDLIWKRKNSTLSFPIMTSLVVSVILTVILNLIVRRK